MKLCLLPVFSVCLLAATLSSCVPASPQSSSGGGNVPTRPAPQPTEPSPQPAQPVAPVMQGDWSYWPVTPGDWVYRRDERGSIALFGEAGRDALVSLRCDSGRRTLYLSRAGTAQEPTTMTLRASQGLQSYTANPVSGASYVAAAIAPNDEMLDKLAYSRGRFLVDVTGMAPLKLPSWAEVARVVEDCR